MTRVLRFLLCAACILPTFDAQAKVPRIPPAKAAAWVIPNAQVAVYADVGDSLKMIDEMFDLAATLPVLRNIPEVQSEVGELRASLAMELDSAVSSGGVDVRNKVTLALMSFAMDNAGLISALLVVRGDFSAPGTVDKLLSSGETEQYAGKRVAVLGDSQLAGGGLVYADKQFLVLGNADHVRAFIDRKPFAKSPMTTQLAAMPAGTLLAAAADIEGLLGVQAIRAEVETNLGRPILDMVLGLKSASVWIERKGLSLSVTAADEVAAAWARDTLSAASDYLAALPLLLRGTGLLLLANAGLLEADLPPELLHFMADSKEFTALVDWVYKATRFAVTVKSDKKKLSTVLSAKGDVPALMLVLSVSGAAAWYLHTTQAAMEEDELLRQLRELEEMQNLQEGEGEGAPLEDGSEVPLEDGSQIPVEDGSEVPVEDGPGGELSPPGEAVPQEPESGPND